MVCKIKSFFFVTRFTACLFRIPLHLVLTYLCVTFLGLAEFSLTGSCTAECTAVSLPPAGIVMFGSQLHTHGAGLRYTTSWYCHVWVLATHSWTWSQVHHQLVLSCLAPSYTPSELVSGTPPAGIVMFGSQLHTQHLVSGTPLAVIVMCGSKLHTHGAGLMYTTS